MQAIDAIDDGIQTSHLLDSLRIRVEEILLDRTVRPRQLSRVTGMNYETIRNIAKKNNMKTGTHTQVPVPMTSPP